MLPCPSIAVIALWHYLLWAAVLGIFVASIFGLRTRWARQRPLARCVFLSLAAHAVLIAIAALIRFTSIPPGAGQDEPVRVTIVASAPQPSIKAPDSPAATDRVTEDAPRESVSPESAESLVESEAPVANAATESSANPSELQAPELMPPPIVADQGEQAAEVSTTPAPIEPEQVTQTLPSESSQTETTHELRNQPLVESPDPPTPDITPASPAPPATLAERVKPDRLQYVVEQGGSPDTEQAVGLALEWLAGAQSSDGRWDSDRWQGGKEFKVLGHNREGAGVRADTGITGLALLTFLGAGHTHRDGPYLHHVAGGLAFLIRSQDVDGSLAGGATRYARTYCHSMATFALAEAYALTKDERLEPSVRKAVQYLLRCENPSFGGWRYKAGDQGDVSQLGWIIMALRSAELAGIHVPDATWQRIEGFLARVARGRQGGLAAYQSRTSWSRSMTAEAMYCRQILGKPLKRAALHESLDALSAELPGDDLTNYYYWYYGALALHHAQHDDSVARHTWYRWNDRMKRELVGSQVTDGSNAGSWSPNTVWGGYGGRVYTTSLAAMCLEVYYRYGAAAGGESPWVASRPRGDTPLK